MTGQVQKCNVTYTLSSQNTFSVKEEECQEDDFVDDKVHVSQTAIIINNAELKDQLRHDKINQYKVCATLDNVKAELSSFELQYATKNNNVKIEEGISANDIKMEIDNGPLYCEHCLAYYEDYCVQCGMLVHILNKNAVSSADNGSQEELPNDILEIQNTFGQFGVFAVEVIPEGVKFGPFIGLSRTECPWKIKGGKFVFNKNKSKYLNWMQYINPARNSLERNLLVFEREDNLYCQSTRQIQKGDELLVYFGDEYEDSLNKNIEVDFIPTTAHIVNDAFACTYCCLGFSSISYLAKHKTICPKDVAGGFSIEELTQCLFCKIHLDSKEYFENHMTYCCKGTDRKCMPPTTADNRTAETNGRKERRLVLHKCGQCNYNTKYKADLKKHTNQHYEVKTHKCDICNRRFKTKESLAVHLENRHVYVAVKEDPEHSTHNHMNAPIKAEYSNSHDEETKQFKCSQVEFPEKCLKIMPKETAQLEEFRYKCTSSQYRTNAKELSIPHIKTAKLKESNYKCEQCDYKTNHNSNLKMHAQTKHLQQFNYRCDLCHYKTNLKSDLEKHVKAKHLKEFDHKCVACDYKTNNKRNLAVHIKARHLNEFDYRCDVCNYKTNRKSDLKVHTKNKHLKEFSQKCEQCDFKTNDKSKLTAHVKTKHLKEFDYYGCDECDYRANFKSNLRVHVNTKHLQKFNYKCELCGYKANYKSKLGVHMKSKHLNEFDYKCEQCDYKTNDQSKLTGHVKTKHLKELNYRCEQCDYKTNYKSNLRVHVNTKHLKEFDYKCEQCEYETNEKSKLRIHIKTKHLEEFDYECKVCDYKTNEKSKLGVHLRGKHQELSKV